MGGEFPRTKIEALSVSRLVIGTNSFMGWSHLSKARDQEILETMTPHRIADVIEVFLRAGVDALLGLRPDARLADGIKEAEDRTGRGVIKMAMPGLDIEPGHEAENARILDEIAAMGSAVCLPHQNSVDALVDRHHRRITGMVEYAAMIRQRGMIPGLSSHVPYTPVFADESGLDVAVYTQLYNAAGFLMQVEAEWVHRMIWNAKHPVIAIKPLAAGRLTPFVGLSFAWSTIRATDMVAVGCRTPGEATEVIETSLAILDRRCVDLDHESVHAELPKEG